jgi:hypothetical protein
MPLSRSQLIAGHQGAILAVRRATLTTLTSLWQVQPGYRDVDVDAFVRRAVPIVKAGQTRTAALTSAYVARMTGEKPVTVDRKDVTAPRGVDPDEVYIRPAVTVRTELSQGSTYTAAVNAGLTRLVSLATTDLQLAKTHQANASMGGSHFQFYARVLTGAEDCALCVIASTQRYSRGDLMPIHPGCDCDVEPLPSGDWQHVINPDLLESTHEQIARFTGSGSDRGARDLGLDKETAKGKSISDFTELIVTREHGEYGPTLAWRKDNFTGPSDI